MRTPYAGSFPADEIIEIPSATPSGRSVPQMARAALRLGQGRIAGGRRSSAIETRGVVGFGGYPTVPPVIAASLLRVPSVLHEANGVMGRANRFLARRASLIATGFVDTKGIPPGRLRHESCKPEIPSAPRCKRRRSDVPTRLQGRAAL